MIKLMLSGLPVVGIIQPPDKAIDSSGFGVLTVNSPELPYYTLKIVHEK